MALIDQLTPEQFAQEVVRPLGRKHYVRVALEQMKVDDILRIKPEAFVWKGKTPGILCRQLERKSSKRFKLYHAVKGGGWIVKRVK